MKFLHMHAYMASKAMMQAKYTEGLADDIPAMQARIIELVRSGWADWKSVYDPIAVTEEDRELTLEFLGLQGRAASEEHKA